MRVWNIGQGLLVVENIPINIMMAEVGCYVRVSHTGQGFVVLEDLLDGSIMDEYKGERISA